MARIPYSHTTKLITKIDHCFQMCELWQVQPMYVALVIIEVELCSKISPNNMYKELLIDCESDLIRRIRVKIHRRTEL